MTMPVRDGQRHRLMEHCPGGFNKRTKGTKERRGQKNEGDTRLDPN